MPGLFDDLVPQSGAPAAPPPAAGGLFDDLLPQKEAAPTAPTGGTAPVPSTLETFFQNLPKYPGVIASRFADLAKGAATGEILPQSANMPGGEKEGDIGAVLSAAQLGIPFRGMPMKGAAFEAPTEAMLSASSKTARYNSPAVTGLQLNPAAGQDVANIIRADLMAAKLDKFNGQPYYDIADRLEKPRFGNNLTLADFEAARQDAQTTASAPGNDRRGSGVIRDAIDSYLGNIPPSHVLSGDATAANDALLKARADFSAMKRSEDVSGALGRAENQAASTFSGHNLDNATRQQLRPILNQKEGVSKVPAFKDYTPEELDALRAAVTGSPLGNLARSVGKKLGGGGGIGHSGIGLGTFFGAHELGLDPVTSAAVGLGTMAAGKGFTALANSMAASRGNYLGNLLRSRSPLADEMRGNFSYLDPRTLPALWPQMFRTPVLGFQGGQ